MSEGEAFQPSELPYHEIVGIVVIAHAVATLEKGLAGVLCCRESYLQVVAVAVGVAQGVAVGIAEVAIVVALAFIERYLSGEGGVVLAILGYGAPRGETLRVRGGDVGTVSEQLHPHLVERGDHGELAHALHVAILVEIRLDVLYLLVGEERQPLQVFLGGSVEVDGVLGNVAYHVVDAFPALCLGIVGGIELLQQLLYGVA